MKKLMLILTSLVTMHFAKAQDESFHKRALIISLGLGGDAYTITEKYVASSLPGLTFSTTFGAGCYSYPLSVEYGIGKRWGIGLIGKLDNYIIKKDSVTGYQPTAVGFEAGVLVNFHFVRTHHIDFFAGVNIGGSGFTYNTDQYNDQLYGSGGWGDIHATLRYYFGRLGIYGSLSFPTMNYSKLTTNNANINAVAQYVISSWDARGVAFNFGVQYRIFSPPAE